MAARTTFTSLADGLRSVPQYLDDMFADAGKLGVIPCTASGVDTIALTPLTAAYAPTISAYSNHLIFSFPAAGASTTNVTVNVSAFGAKNLYHQDGTTQVNAGDLASGAFYIVAYSSALNSSAGGFFLIGGSAPLGTIINIIAFGADPTAAASSSIAFAAAVAEAISLGGGTIIIPPGDYLLTTELAAAVASDIVRPIKFMGGGGYPGASETRLQWKPSSSSIGLHLTSVQQFEFEGIEFVSGNNNVSTLISVDAQLSPAFSTFMLKFTRCGFRTFSGTNPTAQMMRLVNCAIAEFDKCWFSGNNNKMVLGANVASTEGGGSCGDILFNECQIYWDTEVGNVIGATYLNCIFARKDSTTPVRIYPAASGFVRQNNVTFIGCSQVSVTTTASVDFWTQGTDSSGLVALNNRWDGYHSTFTLDGLGFAKFDGNIYSPPSAVAGVAGIVVGSTATNVDVGSENFAALTSGGFSSVTWNGTAYGANTLIAGERVAVRSGNAARFVNDTDSASVQVASFEGDRATPADGDAAFISLQLSSVEGTQREVGRMTWAWLDADEATSTDGRIVWGINAAGTLTSKLGLTSTVLGPFANDGLLLGSSGTAFADLFLADGGVVNWNAGNATLTHSTGLLTSNVPLSLGTSNALTAGSIELGHASDTTFTRVSAGLAAIEGDTIALLTATQTLSGKTLTTPDINAGTADSLTSLSVRDTSAAFDLTFAAVSSSALTAGRILTLDVVNAARSIKLQGNIDLAGNLTTAGALITSGANSLTFTTTGATNVTTPTTGTLSTLAGVETLSNKVLTLPQINDTSSDHQYIFAVNELTADRTVTLPLLTGNDTFVFNDFAAIFTNKTVDLTSNTLVGSVAEFNAALEGADFYTTGGTDVAVADGGTGASTAQVALSSSNLGAFHMHAHSAVAGTAHTGTTSETVVQTIAIPANTIGANGRVRGRLTFKSITNNANVKTVRLRFGASGAGTGGTAFSAVSAASVATISFLFEFGNVNNAAIQEGMNSATPTTGLGGSSGAPIAGAIDTTAATEIAITAELSNGTDSITLASYVIEILQSS